MTDTTNITTLDIPAEWDTPIGDPIEPIESGEPGTAPPTHGRKPSVVCGSHSSREFVRGDRMLTSYTMWSAFRNCRRSAYWRYIRELSPVHTNPNLSFGDIIHQALESWHGHRRLNYTLAVVDSLFSSQTTPEARQSRLLARAIMTAYAERYAMDDFEVIHLEKTFEGDIRNPETGVASRSFTLGGKIDGIVRVNGAYWLLEHKTASSMDGSYLERLWTDFQIILYTFYAKEVLGLPIAGVYYNVILKAKLKQSGGETEEEFQSRHAELAGKNKSGKSSAKRKLPETDEEFAGRLSGWYSRPEAFHRETILISSEQYDILRSELWELTQQFLDARRRDVWYQNPGWLAKNCDMCSFKAICRSADNPIVIENFYERKVPNEELGEGVEGKETEEPSLAF